MIRIYADFNSCDEQGRVQLNTVGSLRDIKQCENVLEEGMRVLLYMTDEFEVYGTLVFEGIWMGIPDSVLLGTTIRMMRQSDRQWRLENV
jgi:hypothetical protein